MTKPVPINVDFKETRLLRQKNNNMAVLNSMKSNDISHFRKNIKIKELTRTLSELGVEFEVFWEKCKNDDMFAIGLAGRLAINASRQGSKDETEQLRTCNFTTQACGVNIVNLPPTGTRPTKDGKLVSKKEMKAQNITKDYCLKSFDGEISGEMTGFIAAKVAFGNGGHQDNVFEEMDTVAEWWKRFKKNSSDYLIILIDTDQYDKFKCIRDKYDTCENIKVFNHVQFQEYVISNYWRK